MTERGFGQELNKYDADGKTIGTTYFERVDIGIRDFLELLPKHIVDEDKKGMRLRICSGIFQKEFMDEDEKWLNGELEDGRSSGAI